MRFPLAAKVCLALVFLFVNVNAITWFPEDFNCPLDNQKNTFLVIGSYGSYIYQYPSKYQWLFFPRTDSPTFYLCKKCSLATFMWDFDKLPKDKFDAIRVALKGVKVSKAFKEYTEIPVVERLEIMEKVYTAIGEDDLFWEDFYRIKGYHYGKAGDAEKAAEARRKSLAYIAKEIADPNAKRPKKLSLYISASMKHFLGDDKAALEDLQKALKTKYEEKGSKPEDVENAETGLNERINDYIANINSSDKKPRMADKGDYDH
jgi:hypothetical protein